MGYGLAMVYEMGYARAFGIPRGMITVSLADFLDSLYHTAIWLSFMWFWLAFCAACASRTRTEWGGRGWLCAALALPLLGVGTFVWLSGYGWVALAILGGGFLAFVVLIAGELAPEAEDKVVTWPMLVKFKEVINLPVDQLRVVVGRYAGTMIVVLVLTCLLAYFLGRYEARSNRDYLVVEGLRGYVVARTYPDRVICVSYRRNRAAGTITLGESVRVVDSGDLSGKKMTWTKRHDLP